MRSSKVVLDTLLEKHKAQPVGIGYIDVIVSRENYKSFIKEVIEAGFRIDAISWWEYIESTDQKNSYGMGGPRSKFYPGWFAEVPSELDEVTAAMNTYSEIVRIIEDKMLGEYDCGLVSYRNTKSLTPAFWLKVDEHWQNNDAASQN